MNSRLVVLLSIFGIFNTSHTANSVSYADIARESGQAGAVVGTIIAIDTFRNAINNNLNKSEDSAHTIAVFSGIAGLAAGSIIGAIEATKENPLNPVKIFTGAAVGALSGGIAITAVSVVTLSLIATILMFKTENNRSKHHHHRDC